jgi:hypothetical protein
MLGTSDAGSESVSADIQADAAKARLLSPCGNDRLAGPVVNCSLRCYTLRIPAAHEHTCLSLIYMSESS